MAQNVRIMIKGILKHCSKAHGGLLRKTLLNDPLKVRERAPADKQDVVCIYRCHGGHGIFLIGAYRYLHCASFQKL